MDKAYYGVAGVSLATYWQRRANKACTRPLGERQDCRGGSVALILEYEEVLLRQRAELGLSEDEISVLIDSLCAMAHHHQIYFLWRPFLTDVNDELVLELAVSANCEYILTHNIKDFRGSEQFGIRAVTPKEFLQIIREV